MAGRLLAACFLSAALAFLLLVSSGSDVKATTFDVTYTVTLTCEGPDGQPGTGDDTCDCVGGGAFALDQCPDLATAFDVPQTAWWPNDPDHANFNRINTFHAPPEWGVARDFDISQGSYAGLLHASATLSVLNGKCADSPLVVVPIMLYHCSTDNDVGNQITWADDGSNLTEDNDGDPGGMPDGCNKYPAHVDTVLEGRKPRVRLYGWATAVDGSPPTQINFVVMNPGQLSYDKDGVAVATSPEQDLGDSLGYSNRVIMDNPEAPATVSSTTEFCTPLSTKTTLWGRSGGQGVVVPMEGAKRELATKCMNWQGTNTIGQDDDPADDPGVGGVADDGCWVVQDWCGDGAGSDPMCGEIEHRNANAAVGGTTSGVYGTATHIIGIYSESQRDADGDGFSNNMDACPYQPSANLDGVCGCDGCPNLAVTCPRTDVGGGVFICDSGNDEDGDTYMNRQDLCPFDPPGGSADQVDDDNDGIGAPCDVGGDDTGDGEFANEMARGGICVGDTDNDPGTPVGDGWCDDTETLLGSDPNSKTSMPEYYGIDYTINSAESPPGAAPGTCSDLTYYGTTGDPHLASNPPTTVDNDLDGHIDMADMGCLAYRWCLKNVDDDGDTNVNDGCPAVGPAEDAGECLDAADQDGDTNVNDGCPAKDVPEDAGECLDAIDDDGDTNVNDGCPAKDDPEDPSCVDAIDNGEDAVADNFVNDGCPAKGDPEDPLTDCLIFDAVDDDADTRVNDGCPAVGVSEADADQCAEESGAAEDDDGDTRINDGCPAKDVPEDEGECINAIDDDADTRVNDGCPVKVDPEDEGECINAVDDDADTAVNDGCPAKDDSEDLPDSDRDGVPNDNCPTEANAEQLDLDVDGTGDACDIDDDGDGKGDTAEWKCGWDAKDACSPFDNDGTYTVNLLDVLNFKPELGTPGSHPSFDNDCNGAVNLLDVLNYKPALGSGGAQCPYRYG